MCYHPHRVCSCLAKGLALIFDLDGVVVDSNPTHAEVWRSYTRRFGIEPGEAMPDLMYGRRNDEIVKVLFGDHLSPDEIFAHGEAKEALYRRIMKDRLTQRLVPGISSFLERYRESPIGLATNAERANAEFVLETTGLRDYFQVVVDGLQVERPKPDPQIYLCTAQLLGTSPQNCVVFEDSFSGVEAARAAGARVVGVTTTHAFFQNTSLNIDNFLSVELEPWLRRQTPFN